MARGDQRPKYSRQPGKNFRPGNSASDDQDEQGISNESRKHDERTTEFIKRVLCSTSNRSGSLQAISTRDTDAKTLEELLPPLTSSNEVDIQLYAIIAVILNQFVQSWYNRITPDHEFGAEVVQIIAHCTRGIEQRLRHVDLEEILLDELPALVVAHIDGMP